MILLGKPKATMYNLISSINIFAHLEAILKQNSIEQTHSGLGYQILWLLYNNNIANCQLFYWMISLNQFDCNVNAYQCNSFKMVLFALLIKFSMRSLVKLNCILIFTNFIISLNMHSKQKPKYQLIIKSNLSICLWQWKYFV